MPTQPDEASRAERSPTRDETLDALYQEERVGASRAVLFHAAVAAEAGINITDVTCLAILDKNGPQTPGQLADAMALSRGGAITALLDRLERAGFVRRERDTADRRRVLIELVRDGQYQALQRLFEEFGTDYGTLLAEYDDSQLALLLDFSRRTNEIVRRHTIRLGTRGAGA